MSLSDLWAQHNEHRLLFPELIMLVLARWSGWDIRYELIVNIGLAIVTWAALVFQAKRTLAALGVSRLTWLLPLLSLTVFSLIHWDNWSWGWQIQIFLNVCAVVMGVVLLSSPNATTGDNGRCEVVTWPRLTGALACGVLATYSFANGLLFWPLGLVLLCIHESGDPKDSNARATKRTRIFHAVVWILAATLTISSYLYGYANSRYGFSFMGFVSYILTYLGAPIVNFNEPGATIMGFLGVLGQIYLVAILLRKYRVPPRLLLPYMALSAYSFGSAIVTAVGRSALGVGQATAPRYITIAYLFWVTTLVFLYLVWRHVRPGVSLPGSRHVPPDQSRASRYAGICIAILVCLILLSSARGAWGMYSKHSDLTRVHDALLKEKLAAVPDSTLKIVYSDPAIVRVGLEILRRRHLSLYRGR